MLQLTRAAAPGAEPDDSSITLPALLLSRYLFFLSRRPISASNMHYLQRRAQGLKTISRFLDRGGDPASLASVRLLRGLTPMNLLVTGERLQLNLLRAAQTVVPRDYLTVQDGIPNDFVRGSARIAIVLGPAVGIGDEIITHPLPAWIKLANPDADITVLSGYRGLWDRVDGVDRIVSYATHDVLIDAIRGDADDGPFDLVLLIDFENPELYQAITGEPSVHRYAELAIGAQVLNAVDNRRRTIYRNAAPAGYFGNFYDGFDRLVASLGLPTGPRFRPTGAKVAAGLQTDELTVFVSPFSSKYDPSVPYWSRLIAGLSTIAGDRPVSIRLDTGPNTMTRRLAAELCRNASSALDRARTSGIDLAVDGPSAPLSISGVVGAIEQADLVVCVDSFAAHLGASIGRPTFVLPSPGLENWRVPAGGSYYFEAGNPMDEILAGMRFLVTTCAPSTSGDPAAKVTGPGASIAATILSAARALSLAVDAASGRIDRPILEAFEAYVDAMQGAAQELVDITPSCGAAFTDFAYAVAPRGFDRDDATITSDDHRSVHHYITSTLLAWRNTNLAKWAVSMGSRPT